MVRVFIRATRAAPLASCGAAPLSPRWRFYSASPSNGRVCPRHSRSARPRAVEDRRKRAWCEARAPPQHGQAKSARPSVLQAAYVALRRPALSYGGAASGQASPEEPNTSPTKRRQHPYRHPSIGAKKASRDQEGSPEIRHLHGLRPLLPRGARGCTVRIRSADNRPQRAVPRLVSDGLERAAPLRTRHIGVRASEGGASLLRPLGSRLEPLDL